MIPKPPQNPHNPDDCRVAARKMLEFLATAVVVTWTLVAPDGFDIPEGILCVKDLSDHLKYMHDRGFLSTGDYHANLLALVT